MKINLSSENTYNAQSNGRTELFVSGEKHQSSRPRHLMPGQSGPLDSAKEQCPGSASPHVFSHLFPMVKCSKFQKNGMPNVKSYIYIYNTHIYIYNYNHCGRWLNVLNTCTYNRLSIGTSNFLRKSASKSWPQIFWALENHGTWPFIDSCIIFNIRIWAH